jgi:L-threonylcarbamoyladenylate synthase
MMTSHYAPGAKVRLNVTEIAPGEVLMAFGPARAKGVEGAKAVRNLSPKGDPHEAAANLFSMLRELDATGAAVIAVEPIPAEGLGEAINDRLRRAAAPRDIDGISA